MKFHSILALALAVSATAPVAAEEASPEPQAASQDQFDVHAGQLVFSSDGKRVGRITSLIGGRDTPTAVRIIKRSKIVVVPVSALSPGEKPTRLQASLTYDEIN